MTFFAGPPLAPFTVISSAPIAQGESIVPFINGQACGYAKSGIGGVDPEHTSLVFAFSNEQQLGCGTNGAEIVFKLLDAQGNVVGVASQTARWYAWTGDYDQWQEVNLTFGPPTSIHMGNVGGGPESGNAWLRLSLALASLGLAGAVGGFALRRRLNR